MAATKSRSAMIVAANVGMIGARLVPTTAPTTSAVARQSAVPRKVAMARETVTARATMDPSLRAWANSRLR